MAGTCLRSECPISLCQLVIDKLDGGKGNGTTSLREVAQTALDALLSKHIGGLVCGTNIVSHLCTAMSVPEHTSLQSWQTI